MTASSELCHQNFENCPLFLVWFFFFLQLFYCFDPKWFVWLSAGWNLNAADWNLNCDLAAANCESAAELPIKPFSSSHFRFLFVGWFITLYHFVCLGFLLFQKFRSAFSATLCFGDILVYIKHFLFFPPNMNISVSSHATCYSFKGSGPVLVWLLIDVVLPCYLTSSCFFLHLRIFVSS